MDFTLFTNTYLVVCSALGLGYCVHTISNRKMAPLYLTYAALTFLCILLSRIYYAASVFCFGEIPKSFNIGFVGYCAMFLFLFFCNAGTMDKLIRDTVSKNKLYSIVPVVIPVLELTFAVLALAAGSVLIHVRISFLVMSVLAGLAGYLNLKLIFAPDVEDGIIAAIRGYNVLCLLLEILTLLEVGLSCFGINTSIFYIQIALGILYLLMMPVLAREVKKWLQ